MSGGKKSKKFIPISTRLTAARQRSLIVINQSQWALKSTDSTDSFH